MKNSRILVVGYNAWDVLAPLPEVPPPDSKYEVEAIHSCGGGPGATAAFALAGLGDRVRLVTALAGDAAGRDQRAELEAAGVDLASSPVFPDALSPRALILVDPADGCRRILWTRGDLPALPPEAAPPGLLDDVDLLHCDSHEPGACIPLAREARRRGIPVVLDGGTARAGMSDLAPLCSDVISSRIFAPALTGRDDPGEALAGLLAMGPRRVAMTFGAAGCLARDAAGVFHVPAFAVAVRDTTGAGDAFHAGYSHALAAGLDFRECLRWGAAVAALGCRGWGGRSTLPDSAETIDLLRAGDVRAETPPDFVSPPEDPMC